jgi:uncharacterized protein YbjT (DUF2867 family)
MTKTILVTGATGKIGTPTVDRLLAEGHSVRAIVSSQASAERLKAKGARPFIMDLTDNLDLSAFDGVDAALLISPVGETFEKVSKKLIDAAKAASMSRVARISIDTAFIEHNAILGVGHGNADAYLAQSGLRHTILRPSGFMQNFLGMAAMIQQGMIIAPTGNGAVPFIDARDIADAAVAVLTDKTDIDGPVDISGPEPLTMADIAAMLSSRLGHDVTHISPPPEEAAAGLRQAGFDGWLLDAMIDDTAHVAAGHGAEVKDGIERLSGNPPRSMDAFLDEYIAAFRP